MLSSQVSCVVVSGFRAGLDLDTYPLSDLIRPRCAERAKPGRGKPVLIMHIGFFACFSRHIYRTFQQNRHIIFLALVALKLLVLLINHPVACSPRIVVDTHRPSTVTLAAHARRGLTICSLSPGLPITSVMRKAWNQGYTICTYVHIHVHTCTYMYMYLLHGNKASKL